VIVVDTSALMAVLLDEPASRLVTETLEAAPRVGVSAGTMVECFVVARRRGIADMMAELLDDLRPDVIGVDAAAARRIDAAYGRWGRGFHPARLNYGDMFAYDAATALGAPLLYVGEEFAATDVAPAMAPQGDAT
jgi:ribonuclease VapC